LIAASILTGRGATTNNVYEIDVASGDWYYFRNRNANNNNVKVSNINFTSISIDPTAKIRIHIKFTANLDSSTTRTIIGVGLTSLRPSLAVPGPGITGTLQTTPPNFGWSQFGLPDTSISSSATELCTVTSYIDITGSDINALPSPKTLYPVIRTDNAMNVYIGFRQTTTWQNNTELGAPMIIEAYSIPSGIYQNNDV